MYKKPEISSMAKIYKAQLKSEFGIDISHSQALNHVAKLHGARDYNTLISLKDPSQNVLFEGVVAEWRSSEDIDNDPKLAHCNKSYDTQITQDGNQIYIEMSRHGVPEEQSDSMAGFNLCVEVNQGFPCVHIANHEFADYALAVFSTRDGLYLRPESNEVGIEFGTPPSGELLYLKTLEQGDSPNLALTINHCYMELPY